MSFFFTRNTSPNDPTPKSQIAEKWSGPTLGDNISEEHRVLSYGIVLCRSRSPSRASKTGTCRVALDSSKLTPDSVMAGPIDDTFRGYGGQFTDGILK